MPGVVSATASSDTTAPTSTITSLVPGAVIEFGVPITISGTASDAGGGAVGAVEVSLDGATWHRASGTGSWTYTWTPNVVGPITIRSRATDDSGNIEQPSTGVAATVYRLCPCSIWDSTATPAVASNNDPQGVELGVRFRSDNAGYIKGIRFYKGPSNIGPHTGKLWTTTGALLASAPFSAETASGWQEIRFATPVAIAANTVYVASYYTASGYYALTNPYFTSQVYRPPLTALADGDGGGDGVYQYGGGGFPTSTYNASNYWVDVVFDSNAGSTSGPTLASLSPSSGQAGGAGFTLTVTGSNFVSGASVQWNGSARSTTFVSASQLTATIAATDIAAAGTAQVTVANPGGSVSNALSFTITASSYALTVTKTGPGQVTSTPGGINCGSNCSASYAPGTVVMLTATPNKNRVFQGWGGACTGTGTCSVTMNATQNVTATFSSK